MILSSLSIQSSNNFYSILMWYTRSTCSNWITQVLSGTWRFFDRSLCWVWKKETLCLPAVCHCRSVCCLHGFYDALPPTWIWDLSNISKQNSTDSAFQILSLSFFTKMGIFFSLMVYFAYNDMYRMFAKHSRFELCNIDPSLGFSGKHLRVLCL